MPRFGADVKLFVLDARAEGKRWKAITRGIEERFNIQPPTIRAIQKWEKRLDRMTLTAEVMKDINQNMPAIAAEAQVRFAQDLMPVLWNARDAGQDMELSGWKWFLQFMEGRLGSERFEFMVQQYMEERKK